MFVYLVYFWYIIYSKAPEVHLLENMKIGKL